MLPYSGIRTARKLYTGGGRDGQYLQDTVCMSEKNADYAVGVQADLLYAKLLSLIPNIKIWH